MVMPQPKMNCHESKEHKYLDRHAATTLAPPFSPFHASSCLFKLSGTSRDGRPHWILRRPRLDPKALQNARNLKSLDTTFGQGNE
jgi:hypothetical protein